MIVTEGNIQRTVYKMMCGNHFRTHAREREQMSDVDSPGESESINRRHRVSTK